MKYIRELAIVACLLFVVGCGGGIPTFPVTGKVTDSSGAGIEGAAITFMPDGGETAIAIGMTGADGSYTLKTKDKDGAQAGSYKVTVAKYKAAASNDGEGGELDDPDDITDEYPDDFDEQAETDKAAKDSSGNELPAKYGDPAQSGFTATVTEGENSFDFKIED
ncbi:MAG: carboxypeptidase-like regulatory domain-containing protein [Planctomycetota bacterium]